MLVTIRVCKDCGYTEDQHLEIARSCSFDVETGTFNSVHTWIEATDVVTEPTTEVSPMTTFERLVSGELIPSIGEGEN